MNLLKAFLKHKIVCTDTRNIEKGCIFFALKGENFNGNCFAEEALNKGAALVVIDEPQINLPANKVLLVENCLVALQNLANQYRNYTKVKVIAITGSNGKTTTKELMQKSLETTYKTHSTPGNFNNHIGVPLTLLRMPIHTQFAIIEMGDNKPKDIAELCNIAEPDFGLITNVGKDHLEGYGSMEGNILTKKELFDYIEKKNGVCFGNFNDPIINEIKPKKCKLINTANKVAYMEDSLFVSYKSPSKKLIKTNLIGDYNLNNINFVYAVCMYLNVIPELIDKSIQAYFPRNNRSQMLETPNNQLVLDAYNANPSSVEPALLSFNKIKSAMPKIVILGDMLELGEISFNEHKKMLQLAESCNFSTLYTVGKNYLAHSTKSAKQFENTIQLLEFFKINRPQKNLILLKGSRGMRLEQLVEVL